MKYIFPIVTLFIAACNLSSNKQDIKDNILKENNDTLSLSKRSQSSKY